jgi:hypothetical protein
MKITEADFRKKGTELYGEDVKAWEFVCPSCKTVLSFNKFMDRKEELKGKGWEPVTECIGRYLHGVGCDWAAYGLFCGPGEIINEDGSHSMWIFNFAKDKEA